MSTTVLAKRTKSTNGTTNPHEDSSRETFLLELGRLAQRWKSHEEDNVALRHETGTLLNRFYGDPTTRQTRGLGVMKDAAEWLGKTEAELSQLRRFAHHFVSVDVLKAQYPEATNWTKVRDLLPGLSQGGEQAKPSRKKASTSRLRKVTQPLHRVTSAFGKLGNELTAKERERLVQVLKKFVEAVPDCLKIRLVID